MRFFILVGLFIISSAPAFAECIASYEYIANNQKTEADSHVGTWSDRPFYETGETKMWNLSDVVTSLGIPNMIGTTEYSKANADYSDMSRVYALLKDAQIGGGIHLIRFVEELRNKVKPINSIDIEFVASIIRDANEKNYLCTAGMATYAEAEKIIMDLLNP